MLRFVRFLLVPFLVGALSLGAAWAGAGLAPAPVTVTPDDLVADTTEAEAQEAEEPAATTVKAGNPGKPENPGPPAPPADVDGLLAGAAKVSIYPDPDEEAGEHWEREGCETLGGDAGPGTFGHMGDLTSPWPENPDCIYLGGYGIGPMNAAKEFDTEYGLWARSVALGNGDDTLVLTVVDGVYWFGEYDSMCDGCGAFDLQAELGEELGIDPAGLIFAATHSHTGPDFIGGWGGVPTWYMEQVADAMRDSVREAVTSMRPATIEAGEELAREHNRERRNTYRSAEEAGLSWFRAVDAASGETIATTGAYAAHPVSFSISERLAHPDWPGPFIKRLEDRFGGVGLHFMTGLGNISPAGGTQMGAALAELVPEIGEGRALTDSTVRVEQRSWDHPVTNSVLTALALPKFFDRPFSGPAAVSKGKNAQRPCVSSSAVSVHTQVTAARVGNLYFTAAPGEIFGNYSNTIKERTAGPNTIAAFPLGMANDAMGYIIQSVETFDESRQGLGFSGQGAFEYEDAYSIDRCFGDMALETTIGLLGTLNE
jgi:hypothetical protein